MKKVAQQILEAVKNKLKISGRTLTIQDGDTEIEFFKTVNALSVRVKNREEFTSLQVILDSNSREALSKFMQED